MKTSVAPEVRISAVGLKVMLLAVNCGVRIGPAQPPFVATDTPVMMLSKPLNTHVGAAKPKSVGAGVNVRVLAPKSSDRLLVVVVNSIPLPIVAELGVRLNDATVMVSPINWAREVLTRGTKESRTGSSSFFIEGRG